MPGPNNRHYLNKKEFSEYIEHWDIPAEKRKGLLDRIPDDLDPINIPEDKRIRKCNPKTDENENNESLYPILCSGIQDNTGRVVMVLHDQTKYYIPGILSVWNPDSNEYVVEFYDGDIKICILASRKILLSDSSTMIYSDIEKRWKFSFSEETKNDMLNSLRAYVHVIEWVRKEAIQYDVTLFEELPNGKCRMPSLFSTVNRDGDDHIVHSSLAEFIECNLLRFYYEKLQVYLKDLDLLNLKTEERFVKYIPYVRIIRILKEVRNILQFPWLCLSPEKTRIIREEGFYDFKYHSNFASIFQRLDPENGKLFIQEKLGIQIEHSEAVLQPPNDETEESSDEETNTPSDYEDGEWIKGLILEDGDSEKKSLRVKLNNGSKRTLLGLDIDLVQFAPTYFRQGMKVTLEDNVEGYISDVGKEVCKVVVDGNTFETKCLHMIHTLEHDPSDFKKGDKVRIDTGILYEDDEDKCTETKPVINLPNYELKDALHDVENIPEEVLEEITNRIKKIQRIRYNKVRKCITHYEVLCFDDENINDEGRYINLDNFEFENDTSDHPNEIPRLVAPHPTCSLKSKYEICNIHYQNDVSKLVGLEREGDGECENSIVDGSINSDGEAGSYQSSDTENTTTELNIKQSRYNKTDDEDFNGESGDDEDDEDEESETEEDKRRTAERLFTLCTAFSIRKSK